jgi:nitrite reductase/ring-hydroxylating ferredoxin subunit
VHPIATYRRTIRASRARVWENVLDWEHLPWLHASSFLGVELVAADRDGWRAWVTVPPAERPRRSLVDVRLARDQLHYWTRTVDGFGTGSAIRTVLAPRAEHATDIAVEFFVPGLAADAEPAVARGYRELYARLWDEDEAMMVRRQDVIDAASTAGLVAARPVGSLVAPCAPLPLGPLATLRPRLPLVVGAGRDAVRVIEADGALVAHAVVCPHLGGPLDAAPVCDGVVTCPWHGYRFDVRTGAAADGRSLRLAPAPRVDVDADGRALLVWPAA